MQQGEVVELTANLALEAAKLSIEEKLPLADSVMLATSRAYEALFWTQDSEFENMSGIKYVKKV
ncbi:MAG: PIN domain-containing protein [Candidatus Aminicenantes bacterium]|nr:PIN domain-containing protein [Candidatus Aminicenantes bacterium]